MSQSRCSINLPLQSRLALVAAEGLEVEAGCRQPGLGVRQIYETHIHMFQAAVHRQ